MNSSSAAYHLSIHVKSVHTAQTAHTIGALGTQQPILNLSLVCKHRRCTCMDVWEYGSVPHHEATYTIVLPLSASSCALTLTP